MHGDGSALLSKARHIDDAGALAFEMRRHAENGADGDDAGTANAGDDHGIGPVERRMRRLGRTGESADIGRRLALGLPPLAAVDRDEARAKAFDAGEILVARILVDGALAAEFGLDRLDGDAVGLHAAIAAALADQLVDHHPHIRIGKCAALAAAALLGRTGLFVDEDGDALGLGKIALHAVEIVAMGDARARGKGARGKFLRLIGDDRDALGSLGFDRLRHLGNAHAAIERLPAGHGDGVIIEQLEGDVHA